MANQHHILKQVLQLDCSTPSDQQALTEDWSRIGKTILMPVLETALDRLDDPSSFLRLGRIEVELEVNSLDSLERAIQNQLPAELATAIQAAIGESLPGSVSTGEQHFLHKLLHYLRTGYMPWYAPGDMTHTAMQQDLSKLLQTAPELADELLDVLVHNPHSIKRFERFFSSELKWELAVARYPVCRKVREALEPEAALAPPRFWKTLLEQAHQQKASAFQLEAKLRQVLTEGAGDRKEGSRGQGESSVDFPVRGKPQRPEAEPETPSVPEEGIFIRNAGMVLMHPFLPGLFAEFGLVNGHEMVHPERAMQLLHYAVYGASETAEWEWPLLKLLCGIPLEEVVDWDAPVPDAWQAEVSKMLSALIRHWAILKNTSPQALRESFFLREGRLTQNQAGWVLRVEQRGIDLLLDQLPWSISQIKMPWMSQRLLVEWS